MKWTEISIHTTQEAIEAVSNILHEAGAGGVVIEDPEVLGRDWSDKLGEIYDLNPKDYPDEGVIVKAYLPVNDQLIALVDQIKGSINDLRLHGLDVGHSSVSLSEVSEEDWATAWKKYYKPTSVTDRLTIKPTWETYEPKSTFESIIELDPGMAFGTGTHPTTVLCLKLLEKYIQPGMRVLDVGTGSGVLSIAAAKLGASVVTAIDLDEVAVRSARENVKQNNVDSVVDVKQGNLISNINGTYDMVIANILADVIVNMSKDVPIVLNQGGHFIASGIIERKLGLVEGAIQTTGMDIVETLFQGDWVALTAAMR